MKHRLPDTITRKAVRLNFDKMSEATWDYLFDYEKGNGLAACRRAPEWGVRKAWYSVCAIKAWLLDRGYYTIEDFDPDGWPIPTRKRIPHGLRVTTHVLA